MANKEEIARKIDDEIKESTGLRDLLSKVVVGVILSAIGLDKL